VETGKSRGLAFFRECLWSFEKRGKDHKEQKEENSKKKREKKKEEKKKKVGSDGSKKG